MSLREKLRPLFKRYVRWLRYSKPPSLKTNYAWLHLHLRISDGSFYTGSTKELERRLEQHQKGEGANHTKKHLPVKLVYVESFERIDQAFYREKQIQGMAQRKEISSNQWPTKSVTGIIKSLSR